MGDAETDAAPGAPGSNRSAIFFDGTTNRRRVVGLNLADQLEICEDGAAPVRWAYADIRQTDSPGGTLRLSNPPASALARLEIRDAALAAELVSRCDRLREH